MGNFSRSPQKKSLSIFCVVCKKRRPEKAYLTSGPLHDRFSTTSSFVCLVDRPVSTHTNPLMSIENLKSFDPFADAAKGDEEGVQDGLVHIRIQQRNNRKTLTTIQGLSSEYDLKKIVRACKKEFACNGTVVEHPEYGEVLQMQGDQRTKICGWLTKIGLVKQDQLKVHGF